MKRREFIALAGGAAAGCSCFWPQTGRAQQPGGMRRIGVLMGGAESDTEERARLAALRQGLEELGWSEGRNIRFDFHFGGAATDQFQALAKKAVALQSDVYLALGTSLAAAMQRESRTVPIVFVNLSDPVGAGFVASLARPGGNMTGMLLYEASIAGKWLAMLKEIAPRLTRAAFVANPRLANYDYFLRSVEVLAPKLAIELVPSPVETAADIERAIESFARAPNGGLIVPPGATAVLYRELIIALAARHRLPAVYTAHYYVADGGLMSYGTNEADQFRRAADYIDRILRGAKPADLPVQTPLNYETTLNLKTAKALGLTFPPGLLLAATEVIE